MLAREVLAENLGLISSEPVLLARPGSPERLTCKCGCPWFTVSAVTFDEDGFVADVVLPGVCLDCGRPGSTFTDNNAWSPS